MLDDFDSVVADRFAVIDDLPVPDTWTRVQSKVLDRPFDHVIEQESTMIDLETPNPADEHRTGLKRVMLAGLLAAAAVFAVVLVTVRDDDPVSPATQPSPTVTVKSTAPEVLTVNPLVDIRSRLVDMSDVELFRVNSDTARFWRLTTLPRFDGHVFSLPPRSLGRVEDIDGGAADARVIRQQIEILALTGQMVPAAGEVYEATSDQDLRFNADTGTLITSTGLVPGDQFTIESAEPELTAEELQAATTDDPPDEMFLGLPDDVADIVYEAALEVTAGATTDYDRLILLQNWFRTNFEYSLDVQAGHGNDAIEQFLRNRVGYSEQFAATFAVMARTLGIPSRVAVGFTPGELRSDRRYSVLGRNSHAWPEVWFDDIGWVDFEPTPGRGIPGAEDYTGVLATQNLSAPSHVNPSAEADAGVRAVDDGPVPTAPAPAP